MKLCNLDYLKSVTPDSYNFPIQIIELFLNDTPTALIEIKKEIIAQNWPEVYAKTHKLKPSITILGFPQEIINAILSINISAKSETNTDQIISSFELIERSMNEIYKELQQEVTELKAL